MSGKGNIRFGELFASTLQRHGVVFAEAHYVRRHRMPRWEFAVWLAIVGA